MDGDQLRRTDFKEEVLTCSGRWDRPLEPLPRQSNSANGSCLASRETEGRCNGKSLLESGALSALKRNGLLRSLTAGDGERERKAAVSLEVLRAEEEWDALEATQAGLEDTANCTPLISFNEALQHFQTADLSEHRKTIQPTVRRTGLSAISHFLFGPPRLHRDLMEERDLVFTIAQCCLDNAQNVHMRVLQTIYKKLMGEKLDCARYGSHWEQLGFQGLDPGTDLRGTGFLGLMHPLYMVMDLQILPLARDIYKLSQHETQNFPFCVMSINITRLALQALREECLTKECNRRRQVVAVLNDFYVAAFLHLYQLWKSQCKSICDSGFVLKELSAFAKKNPKQLLRRLDSHLTERRSGGGGAGGGRRTSVNAKDMDFLGVCELGPETDSEGEIQLI